MISSPYYSSGSTLSNSNRVQKKIGKQLRSPSNRLDNNNPQRREPSNPPMKETTRSEPERGRLRSHSPGTYTSFKFFNELPNKPRWKY